MSTEIPSKTQILVIGGGPAGSYSATCLAREGFQVTLLEAASFPRYHIGESLLPSMRTYLSFIGAFEKVCSFGFVEKPGGVVKFNQHKREGYTDFKQFSNEVLSWHVTRADFDDILLKHAKECGVNVIEETRVNEITFEDGDVTKRPIAASWKNKTGSGTISFDYVIDASGRNGIMSTKYFKSRKMHASLKNVALWGYWKDCGRYAPGTGRENAIWVEALKDESGWLWFIPLHDGTVSVGVVQAESKLIEKKAAFRALPGNENSTLQDFYLAQIPLAPGAIGIIGPKATLLQVGKDGGAAVKQAADYSYSATQYAGPGYRLAGDAGCFIDPFFSSGVHLAFTGGLSAAATIASTIRGIPEADAIKWHNAKVGVAYTRFLMIVLGSYKQILNQNADIMSNVDEDNFDRAFDLIRPIIQGTSDINKKLAENEVAQVVDFMKDIAFAPQNSLTEEAPTDSQIALNQNQLEELQHRKDEGWSLVKGSIVNISNDFASEAIHGYTILMERGKFCMVKVPGAQAAA